MIIGPVFITLTCDSMYDYDEHRFANMFTATINIDQIQSICDYMPEDEEFAGQAGSEINFDDGSRFVTMAYKPNQIEEMIEDAIANAIVRREIKWTK